MGVLSEITRYIFKWTDGIYNHYTEGSLKEINLSDASLSLPVLPSDYSVKYDSRTYYQHGIYLPWVI